MSANRVPLNLTVNTSDAMPLRGKLTFETQNVIVDRDHARRRPSAEPDTYVLVCVSDTGQGMDAATEAQYTVPTRKR